MWNGWVDKEIDHVRWLAGRLEMRRDALEAGRLAKELEHALDRLQMGFWELQDRLDQALVVSQESAKLCPAAVKRPVPFPIAPQGGQDGPKALTGGMGRKK